MQQTHLQTLVIAGGVGANLLLRSELKKLCDSLKAKIYYPRIEYCTDNAAMIAYAGCQRLLRGEKDSDLAVDVKTRWDLETVSST